MISEIGKTIEKAYDKIDEAWTKMLEDFAKNNKAAKVRREKNPDVLGNQTDAALRRDLRNEVNGVAEPSEALASGVAEREVHGKWQKI